MTKFRSNYNTELLFESIFEKMILCKLWIYASNITMNSFENVIWPCSKQDDTFPVLLPSILKYTALLVLKVGGKLSILI